MSIHKKYNHKRLRFFTFFLCFCLLFPLPIIGAYKAPNDSMFPKQWGLNNTNAGIDINALNMWSTYQSKRQVIVAVIDTGIDYNHKDLKANMWTNSKEIPNNGIDDDNNGFIDDVHGWNFFSNNPIICSYSAKGTENPKDSDNHGTMCAGIIGAVANNKIGIAGVASNVNVKLMPIKVIGGASGQGYVSSIVKAIKYADQMGASICNISLNTDKINYELEQAIRESNMLIICSAGNTAPTGADLKKISSYPASFDLPNLIAVASIQANGSLNKQSNYGKNIVSMAAPGADIYSTQIGNKYGYASGTSMSAAFVTGIAAVAYTTNPNLYSGELKQILESSTQALPSLKNKTKTGGTIDAYKAIKKAKAYKHKLDTTAPKIKYETSWSKSKGTGIIKVKITDTGGSNLCRIRYAEGNHDSDYFLEGNGKYIKENTINISQAGEYTIYADDHAGNSKLAHITIP